MNRFCRLATASILAGATLSLSGCFPLAVTGAAVGALAVLDRRTVGAQTEDESIELKATSQLRSAPGLAGGVSVTSYNRKVLLTGQVPDEAARRRAEQIVAGIDNVRTVHNEIQVSGRVAFSTTSGDALITTKVKAALVDARDIQAHNIKVVTENGVVHLMGLVVQREAERAAQVASRVGGVQRVVTVFEVVSDDELQRIRRVQGGQEQAGRQEGASK